MHAHIKELPNSDQPYEKCLNYGPEYLSDTELIAVIIRTGTSGTSVIELAQKVLQLKSGNLLNLYRLSIRELQEIPGIGRVKAVQLKCIGEISKRIAKTASMQQVSLNSAYAVAEYYKEQLRHEEKECLLLSMFDAKCKLLGNEIISIGTVCASLVSPREIFLKAFEYHAVHIILLHNHPSGIPTPSQQDKRVTIQIKQCGELLGIQLSDHIIIGDNEYYSYREQ